MSRHLDSRTRDESRRDGFSLGATRRADRIGVTADAASASNDLGRDQRYVAAALWRVLAPEATAGHDWPTEIGKRVERVEPEGDGVDGACAMLDARAEALSAESAAPGRDEVAARILDRVRAMARRCARIGSSTATRRPRSSPIATRRLERTRIWNARTSMGCRSPRMPSGS